MTSLLYNHLKGDWSEVGVSLLCHVSIDRKTANGLKCPRGGSDYILEKKIVERVIRHWNTLSRVVVESPSLQTSVSGTWGYGFGVIIVVRWVDSWIR